MPKIYVYSTLATDQLYRNYAPGGADMPVVTGEVFVKGGAGVANDRVVTPRGVVTEVTAQEAEVLRADPVFRLHEKNGYVVISEVDADPDKVAADMTGRDNSAPIVPHDLPNDAQPMNSDDEEDAPPPAKRGKRK